MSRYGWLTESSESAPITQGDLDQIENYADRIFAKLGIDVEFTRHFLDRVNDARNEKQISMAELTRLFKQQYKKNGKKIAQLGPGAEAVMKDMQTDVNMPFALVWDKQSQELDLIAKTVMRKKNFGTSNPVVAVENESLNEAFNDPYPVNWFQKTQEAWEGSAQLPDGSKLFIDITDEDGEGYYNIEFSRSDSKGMGATMKATGEGNEFRIFATVQAGILEWWQSVDEDDVQKITFNASKQADDSKNRYKLYARFAKQWANKIGWVATSREEDGSISFVLIKPAAAKFAKDQDLEVMEDVDYVKPQFDVEWEEANRYSYFDKLGQAGWEQLASKGKVITLTTDSVKQIGNTGADGSESLDDLEPDKVARLQKAMDSGTVEMPIVVKQPDGSLDLVAGNTRLIGLISTQGVAKVWLVDASGLSESVYEDIDVNTQRGRLAYYLKQPQIKKGMAVHLGKLPKYHDGTDELADMVPDRAGVFALHPDAWESTFYSLTNKDFKKITFYKPAIVKIPPNSIVGDMAIANKFYRTNDAEEKQTHAEAYRDSIVPYGSDTSHIKMPEIIMPRLIESAGVGIVTKQNATKDVPIGGEYNNVKKVFPKMKHKQKHLTQVETLEEMFKKAKARVQEDVLEPITPQLSGYTKYTPTQLAIMEGGHTLEEEDPAVRKLRIKLKGQLDESISEELTEGFFSNLIVGTGIALAAFGAGSFFTKDISKPEVAKEIVVVQQTEVQPGDTIYSLARELKIDPKVLYKLNGYDHTTELQVGEKIKIPDFDVKPKQIKKIPTNFLDKGPIPKPKADVVPITNKKLERVLLVVAKKSGLEGDELAAFMAQCAHESNQYRTLTEYGGSLDFRKYDPRYAPKKARALGNTKRGDGAKYKGRGYIQITGKYNYTVAGKAIGMDLVNKPELAAEPLVAAKIALWYWSNRVAPKVNDFTNTREVTKPINPGMRGLEQRIEYHDSYKKLAMASLSKGSEG